jgi:DNA-binding transcriptional MocR family regulator
LDSERLTVSYRLLAEFLREWRIDFIAPSHGIFLFARLAKHAKTAEDEKGFYDRLAVHGVRVGQGRFYEGVKGEFGWARIRFSLPVEDLKRALGSIAVFLSRNRC